MAGIVLDRGVTDANNMGAAMAPAAESTLCRFFEASGTFPGDYDLIVTGDLGWEGSRILCDLMDTHSAGGAPAAVAVPQCWHPTCSRAYRVGTSGGCCIWRPAHS